ncbi:MAG: acyl-CoA dehydrogenase family protein [Actinomycetota bacterium]
MTPTEVLDALFVPASEPDPRAAVDVRAFLAAHGPPLEGTDDGPSYFARLVRVAVFADRRSLASVAGHQAAIRRLFPATPDDSIVAFCVSEDRGPRPSHIHTSLTPVGDGDNHVMNGHKRWGSMAPVADLCYVAASVGHGADGRNQLRMVHLPTDRPGITIDLEPYVEWGPEFQICDLHFNEVPVAAADIIPGDGYVDAIKPFRLVEDVYNTAGTLIGLFRLGRRLDWPTEDLERLLGLIVQSAAIAQTDIASPVSVLLLTDFLRRSDAAWGEIWAKHTDVPAEVAEAWSPERGLLGVAAAARDTRRTNAWAALG